MTVIFLTVIYKTLIAYSASSHSYNRSKHQICYCKNKETYHYTVRHNYEVSSDTL